MGVSGRADRRVGLDQNYAPQVWRFSLGDALAVRSNDLAVLWRWAGWAHPLENREWVFRRSSRPRKRRSRPENASKNPNRKRCTEEFRPKARTFPQHSIFEFGVPRQTRHQ